MASVKLLDYLNNNHVMYSIVYHPATYTSSDLSWVTRTSMRDVAKTVIVTVDGDLAMAVVPASRDVDLECLEEELQAYRVRLVGESVLRSRFADCELGAMPPFGNLYGMKVYVDSALAQDELLLFPAGSHQEAIQMTYADFERLVHPEVLTFSRPHRDVASHHNLAAEHHP